MALKYLSIDLANFLEAADLLWRAKFHEGLSYLYDENKEKAKKIFKFIVNSKEKNIDFYNIIPPSDVLERIYSLLETL